MTQNTLAPSGDRLSLGFVLMLGFCVFAPVLDVFAKLAAAEISVGQITAARFIVQGLVMLPVCVILGYRLTFTKPQAVALFWRAFFLAASTLCFVAAIAVMPIADALAIVFVEPFILLLLGKYLYGEDVGVRRLSAVSIGFIGVLMVIQPNFANFGYVALFPLGTAVSFALYMLNTRALSRNMHPIAMQFHTSVFGALIMICVLAVMNGASASDFALSWPTPRYTGYLIGVGVAASVSHLLMSYALRFAPSTFLAPLHYLEIVSAVIFGFVIFGDIPTNLAIWGMVLVVGSGLFVIWRERQIEKRKIQT